MRAVLFDAAGTLFELRRPVGDVYAESARRHGVDLPGWRLDDAFHRVMRRAEPMVFPDFAGATPNEVAGFERAWWRDIVRQTLMATDSTARFPDTPDGTPGLDAWFSELWERFASADAWQLRDGCRDALAELRAGGARLGVLSNFDHRLPALLEALGIAKEFEAVVLPGTCGAAKPSGRGSRLRWTPLAGPRATPATWATSRRSTAKRLAAPASRTSTSRHSRRCANFPPRCAHSARPR